MDITHTLAKHCSILVLTAVLYLCYLNSLQGPSAFYSGIKDLPTSTPFTRRGHAWGDQEHTPGGGQTTLQTSASALSGVSSSGIGSTGLSSIHDNTGSSSRGPSRGPTPSVQASSLPQR